MIIGFESLVNSTTAYIIIQSSQINKSSFNEQREGLLGDPYQCRKSHVSNIVTRSYIASRHGLEQPQGRTDFWWAFLGTELNKANSRGGTATWCAEAEDRVWKGQLQGRCCSGCGGWGLEWDPQAGNSKHSVVMQVK